MKMEFREDNHFIYLYGYMSYQDQKQLSAVKNTNGWRFPKNIYAYRELYRTFPTLQTSQTFLESGKKQRAIEEAILQMKERNIALSPNLREYQNKDAFFLLKRKRALVLNEQRTGKTPTVLTVLKHIEKDNIIVISPSSLLYTWEKEANVWCPEAKTFVVSGTKKKRQTIYSDYVRYAGKKILIISKDTWKLDDDMKEYSFDVVVVDEAHYLRNYKTAQSKEVFKVKAVYRYALTGTPTVKHPSDIWGLLHFIEPEAFPSFWQFAERYFVIKDNYWGGKEIGKVKREDELKHIVNLYSVQRKRKDVMKWLPPVTKQTILVQMEKDQEKLYKGMLEDFVAVDKEGNEVDTMNKLAQLTRLRQLCLEPSLLGLKASSAKTKALLEFAENQNEPFVVMTNFSSYFPIIKPKLEDLGKKVEIIDGSVSKEERFSVAERFQNGEIDVLLCNIIAAGTGLTLDRADTVVFLDKAYNPSDNDQAKDRIVPTSERRYHPINVISIVCKDSVDERIDDIIERKINVTKIINELKF